MNLDHVVGITAIRLHRRLECDCSRRHAPAPLVRPLAPTAAAGAQIVERILPGGIAGERRMLRVDRERIDRADLLTLRLVQGKASAAKGDANHLLELARLDSHPLAGALEGATQGVDLGFDLAQTPGLVLVHLGAGALDPGVVCLLLDRSCQRTGFALPDAASAEPVGDPLGDHAAGRAELALDDLGLAHQRFEDDVLLALHVLEVPAEDLRGRLELTVDSACASSSMQESEAIEG
jgi:hypothetical protein